MLKAPKFWYQQKTLQEKLASIALSPLACVYGYAVEKRFTMHYPVPMRRPVVCVGNLTVGGNGKTPTVLSLAELLLNKGYNPHLLTKGYGGVETGPIQINLERDTAEYIGDEALLLAEKAPTWVANNRPLGAQHAMDSGANVVIMDDGFQNPVIYKDFSLVVIDGKVGFGNDRIMPAGPLRETVEGGIGRADAVLIIGEDATNVRERIMKIKDLPVLSAQLVASPNNPDIQGKQVAAFAGIGRPSKVKESLEAAGADVVMWKEFADHHLYEVDDLFDFLSEAQSAGLPMITTAKDYVRVPEELRDNVQVFAIELQWEDPSQIVSLVDEAITKKIS